MATTDRRVKKTKKLIKETLATILLEKELQYVTVRELTDIADISRSTFYAHYSDIYDLYEQMENDLIKDISNIVVADPEHEYYDVYKKFIDYIYDNATVCRTFMASSANNQFKNKLTDFFEERYYQIALYEMKSEEMKEGWKYISRFINGGLAHLLSLWLENDLNYPKDKLLKLIYDLDMACDELFDKYE